MRILMILITLSLTNLLGCSLEASLEQLVKDAPKTKKGQLTGLISGASAGVKTTGGYKVEAATGNYTNRLTTKTSGGYKVFVSTQGNIVAD